MATQQPIWRNIYTNDYSSLDVDETGVYPPELTVRQEIDENKFYVYRFPLDRCTYINGILSDNKFHPDYPAWFADDLRQVANHAGMSEPDLIEHLTSDDPAKLALAYEAIGSYHGFDNFDNYPIVEDN